MTPSSMSPEKRPRALARALLALLFWLLVWQLAAAWVNRAAVSAAMEGGDLRGALTAALCGRELFLPGIPPVVRALASLAVTPFFWKSALYTLVRVFLGFFAGAVLGIVLAVLTSSRPALDALISPAVRVIRAAPVASFILLLLLWLPTGRTPAVIAGLIALPTVWESLHRGLLAVDPLLLEQAEVLHFSPFKTLRLVRLPAALPALLSGCSAALGLAWKSGVAAEVLCQPKYSVGAQIYSAKLRLETPELFAWTLLVVLLSLLLERLLRRVLRRAKGVWTDARD